MKSFADHARAWLKARGKDAKAAAIKDVSPEPSNVIELAPGPQVPEHRVVSFSLLLGDRWEHGFTHIRVVVMQERDPNMRSGGSLYDLNLRDGEIEKTFAHYVVTSRYLVKGGRVAYKLEPEEEDE